MCGRLAQTRTPDELAELLGVMVGLNAISVIHAAYNVPPTSILASLVATGKYRVQWVPLQWGMVSSRAKNRRPVINARSETVHKKPMFRYSFRSRRCVIPVTAYYEWLSGATGKQPYCIRMASGEPLLLAGLYSGNQCVILTRAARDDIAYIHDRMPVAIPRMLIEQYLHEQNAAYAAFEAAESLHLQVYPVTPRVGNPRYNTPSCLEHNESANT